MYMQLVTNQLIVHINNHFLIEKIAILSFNATKAYNNTIKMLHP